MNKQLLFLKVRQDPGSGIPGSFDHASSEAKCFHQLLRDADYGARKEEACGKEKFGGDAEGIYMDGASIFLVGGTIYSYETVSRSLLHK